MDKKTVGRIISERRKRCGLTLNDLSAGICNKSTLMRIEAGEVNTSTDTLSCILERLGIHIGTLDDANSFDDILVRQVIRNANQADVNGNRTEALELLDTIAGSYDSFSLQNKQRFDVINIMLLFKDGKITAETRLHYLEDSMRETQPDYSLKNLPPIMTDMEAQILRYIAITYGMMGDYDTASDILYHLKAYMENYLQDKVAASNELVDICYNLSKSLGLAERYDESISVAEDAIKYCEYLNNISLLPSCIYNCAKALVSRNEDGDKEKAKALIEEALALCTPKTWNVVELSYLLKKLKEELDS